MIAMFPMPYPDELLYSVLARYFDKSGYTAYTFAAEDLYEGKAVRPDEEFLNHFTEDTAAAIIGNTTPENMIMRHTMFPYYARFLPRERRQKALRALRTMQSGFRNDLAIPKNKTGKIRYFRYCPVCAAEDRATYGETYWHRAHQMLGVNLCPLHLCQLSDSTIVIGKKSPALLSAETSMLSNDAYGNNVVYSENSVEIAVTKYINEVFQSEVDMASEIAAGDFLHSRMEGTKYLSARGEARNIALFQDEFCRYYEPLEYHWFTERRQFEKLFSNYSYNTYEICLAALFLKIPVADLVSMRLPKKPQEKRFDDTVHALRCRGLSYPEIAARLHSSVSTVCAIEKKRYKKYHAAPKEHPAKSGVKTKDWDKIDRETLPLVKDAISKLLGDGSDRPKKITPFAVERILKIPCKRLGNMPLCKAEIEKHRESQPAYWAREALWAAKEILAHNEPFNWKHLRVRTNMRRRDLQACIPYLCKHTDDAALIAAIAAL